MSAGTFIDSCLKELDLVLSRSQAEKTLEAYHKLFPGIRRWHSELRTTVYNSRKLSNPFGRVRYFYGRCDDATYREAYAYRPQSTVSDLVNTLMLKLLDGRTEGQFDFWLHLQTHDSLSLSCVDEENVNKIARYAENLNNWHPEIRLKAGLLRIPVSIEFGNCLGKLSNWEGT
jgi:DNA polymerase I-like protein with 3'-5' exonuclease and polymerase domains